MKNLFLSVFMKALLNRWNLAPSILFLLGIVTPAAHADGSYWAYGSSNTPQSSWVYFTDLLDACVYIQKIANANLAANNVPSYWRITEPIVARSDDGLHGGCSGVYPAYPNGGFDYAAIGKITGSCPKFSSAVNNSCLIDRKNIGKPDDCCSTPQLGDPITVGIGNLFLEKTDYESRSGLSFTRYYNGAIHLDSSTGKAPLGTANWRGTFDRSVVVSGAQQIVYRADGRSFTYSFNSSTSTWTSDADVKASLIQLSGNAGWQFKNNQTDETEVYNSSGKLTQIISRNGYTQTLTYGTGTNGAPVGYLLMVADSFGRALQFSYDASNRITQITLPDTTLIKYTYTNDSVGNLSTVTYPDNKTLTYLYNETGKIPSQYVFSNALTGVLDENANRFASFSYDTSNRAITSEHDALINGVLTPVEKYTFTYNADGTTTVVDAANTTRTYAFSQLIGAVKNTQIVEPCITGCVTKSKTQGYDANGNINSKTDFNGNVTNYIYDLTRNLETSRTEAYGTAQARTITTTWNPNYRLPATITEPGKLTVFTYDASGNVLTKTITDTALNKSRTWTYTYNSVGQVLTADGPRTDVLDKTTYTYYISASSVAGSVHSIGDLATVTNAAGRVTSINHYDLNGRPLSITDPNGVVTTLTYSPRGWLTSRTVNGIQTTQYAYDGVGQLIQVTLPDNSALQYTYDTAHRLTDLQDGYVAGGVLTLTGNKIHYYLDAMGNRVMDATYDPNGTTLRFGLRAFDALNRLQKTIGANYNTEITQYSYDNNGNLKTITDPLNHVTTNGYDALNRLITVTDPANGVSTTAYNALDQTTQVKDPRLVTTNYTINALGDVTLTNSPDSGNTNNVFDAAGNVTQKTDARGIVANYTYDALNRLTGITYPASTGENVTFTYDDTDATYYRLGRLASVYTSSDYVSFAYDAYGNITTLADLSPTVWGIATYQYDNANRIKQITYPSGRIVSYTRNALGQITQVQTQDNASAPLQTLVSTATYEPFGPLKSLTFFNGVTTTIQHDQDYRVGRITTTSTPGWDYVYGYDAASNLTGMTGTTNKSFSYDALNRLTADNAGGYNFTYQYDASGNRTQENYAIVSIAQTYTANTNREAAFAGFTTPLDTAGNLTARATITAMSYNNANRLSQATANSLTTTYQYTGLGQRNLKTGAQTIHYDYLPDGKTLSQLQLNTNNSYNQGVEYIWLDDTPIAQIKTTYTTNNAPSTRRLTYIHADHLNTPRLMTDSTKNIVWKWMSDGYGGAIQPNTNPDGDSITDTLDLRFPGQIADAETGLFYNLNRYYDPLTARYTQSDPIGLRGGNNTYGYVSGNPISFGDPLGLIGVGNTSSPMGGGKSGGTGGGPASSVGISGTIGSTTIEATTQTNGVSWGQTTQLGVGVAVEACINLPKDDPCKPPRGNPRSPDNYTVGIGKNLGLQFNNDGSMCINLGPSFGLPTGVGWNL